MRESRFEKLIHLSAANRFNSPALGVADGLMRGDNRVMTMP
ncbi:MAG: hypothetical protein VYA30_08470 [Myxococcota bacterium]|nr:hypothetical protein [Myxococcota bacterium]